MTEQGDGERTPDRPGYGERTPDPLSYLDRLDHVGGYDRDPIRHGTTRREPASWGLVILAGASTLLIYTPLVIGLWRWALGW